MLAPTSSCDTLKAAQLYDFILCIVEKYPNLIKKNLQRAD